MLEELSQYLKKVQADYADIRYEKMTSSDITYDGKKLSRIGTNFTDGYVIRVLKEQGFASVSVSRKEDIEKALLIATQNAALLGRQKKKKDKLKMPPVTVDDVGLILKEDPRQISLEEKHQLLRHYNELTLAQKDVQMTTMNYFEVYRDKYFVNTLGSKIHYPLVTNGIKAMIICRKGEMIQNGRVGIGGSDGFHILRNREDVFINKAKIVRELLEAAPAQGGTFNVVLDPELAGVFVHEAFGHFSEADLVENMPTLLEKMQIGAELGSDILNIIDDPTRPDQLGYYKYDDEGVAARPRVLMENGILKGRLHSMQTAASFENDLTGHCVAEDARYEPIIRMGCIYIQPQNRKLDELLKDAGNGYYLLECKGGQTSGENFTFGAQYGYKIENGKLGPLVRDINIMGNLFTTLKNITGISDTMHLSEMGGCGKGQMNIKSCLGGPHILIKDALVGGV